MSFNTVLDMANDLDKKGEVFYRIDAAGFFDTTYRAPQITVEVTDPKWIPRSGDNLLRVYCDKGTIALRWPGVKPHTILEDGLDEEESQWFFRGPHIEVFGKTGFPLTACLGGTPVYKKSDPSAKVWATYEIYGDKQRIALQQYRDPRGEGEWGIKLRFADTVWQVGGCLDPGHSHNTICRLKSKIH